MDPARWQRIESICFDTLDQPAASRQAFLDKQCQGDDDLRREVDALLAQIETDPSFLERPLIHLSDPTAAPSHGLSPDESIGEYRIVRPLGRGGMGEVLLAVHQIEDMEQRVAIKIVRRGSDTDDLLHRFRLERRILAGLNHPNIARLLDAGATDDGRPYFVMEHVEGRPIDRFCDKRRLSIEQRLEVFQIICDAVQHAHQNLVVHRDIKPTNILVSDTGAPKLLDFGIGKVLDETESFGPAVETRTNMRMLTPEYAAPEQIAGGSVTTATDVYALGVLLYELLTGRHPHVSGGESLHDIERAILETEPNSPSAAVSRSRPPASGQDPDAGLTPHEISRRRGTDAGQLRRRLTGDLDNIVLKALRKEPDRRYASAAALGDDIARHLRGLPVSARPDTFGYRARKFVRRHTAAVIGTTVAFVALSGTTIVTLVQSQRVARESERVTLERDKALEVQGFLMEMFGTSGADQAVGDTVTARQLLDRQAALVQEAYGGRPDLQADMLMVLADGYDRLGLPATAEPLARDALTIRRSTLGPRHRDTAASLSLLGWIVRQTGRPAEAEELLRDAVDIFRGTGDRYAVNLSRSLNDLGVILVDLARHGDAETVLREALDIRLAAHGESHRSVGITANNLMSVYAAQSRLPEAIEAQELSVRALSGSVGPDHRRTLMAQGNLATLRYMTGDSEGATRDYRSLLDAHIRVLGRSNPATATIMVALANVLGGQANRTRDDSLFDKATALAREAVRIREAALGPSHPTVGDALDHLANILRARGALEEALAQGQRAVRIYREVYGESHDATAGALSHVAGILWRGGHVERAIEIQRRAGAAMETSVGLSHGGTASTLGSLCDMLMYEEPIAQDAFDICERADRALRNAPPAWRTSIGQVRLRLAQLHLDAGRTSAADSILAVVRAAVDAGEGPSADRQLFDRLSARLAEAR